MRETWRMSTTGQPTVVFLHAHPDDETLLTGGTIAKLAREGARVVVITATDGAAGLASKGTVTGEDLSQVRSEELDLATQILGVNQVVTLGYADSGLDGEGSSSIDGAVVEGATPFVKVPLDEVAARVATIVTDLAPDMIIGYDPSGGYGHPDHKRVSELGRAVAERTGIKLYEASLPREPYARVADVVTKVAKIIPPLTKVDVASWETAYLPKNELAVRVDARAEALTKRAALKAHASQGTGGLRTVTLLRAMPVGLFRKLYGIEWYAEPVVNDLGSWEYLTPGPDGPRKSLLDRGEADHGASTSATTKSE